MTPRLFSVIHLLLTLGAVSSFTSVGAATSRPPQKISFMTTTTSRRTSLSTTTSTQISPRLKNDQQERWLLTLRGGDEVDPVEEQEAASLPVTDTTTVQSTSTPKNSQMSMVTTALVSFGQFYGQYLDLYPIRTKSITAGFIFGISDYLAQTIERSGTDNNSKKPYERKRTIAASLVGLLYFGPAAHYWYENIFKLFPATGLVSTLQKALMGQLFFGPSFTCIFFATALLQAGEFSFANWFRKIKSDLAGAWLAGAGFWPLVDLVSYSLVPPRLIPLFVNVCALVWNIYLSTVANRKANKTATA